MHAPAERLNVPVDFGAAVPDCAPLLASFADAKLRAWLAKDLTLLGGTLAALADQAMLHVQLGAAHTDRCKKLHVDYVSLRLITTYYGPGTEWLPNDAARRSVLAEPPECHREANAQIVRDGRRLRRARAGDVLVLKGERSAPGAGAIHRSPAIEATGESRVVVSLTAR